MEHQEIRFKELPVVLLITTNFSLNGYGFYIAKSFLEFSNVFVYSQSHDLSLFYYIHSKPATMATTRKLLIKFPKLSKIFNPSHKIKFPLLKPEDVDLVLVVDPVICNIDLHPFKKAIKVYWAQDTHIEEHKYLHFFSMNLQDYDVIYVAHLKDLVAYKQVSGKKVAYLPLGYESDIYRPLNQLEKKYDISFVGSITQQRLQYLDHIKRRFNHLKIYFGSAYPNDANKIYNSSKIVLNISRRNELNLRVFEVLGSGQFLLTNAVEEVQTLFNPAYHLDVYSNADELLDKIEFYLKEESSRNEIANNGYREVLNKHTLENRASQILRDAGLY
jgi:hypothetical protein